MVFVGLCEQVRLPYADQFCPFGAFGGEGIPAFVPAAILCPEANIRRAAFLRPAAKTRTSSPPSAPARNPHEMRNKNNPMRRNAAWGRGSQKEPAPERRNCPRGNGAPRDAGRSGRLRLLGALDERGVPQARASRRAWGYVCFVPSGRFLRESAKSAGDFSRIRAFPQSRSCIAHFFCRFS